MFYQWYVDYQFIILFVIMKFVYLKEGLHEFAKLLIKKPKVIDSHKVDGLSSQTLHSFHSMSKPRSLITLANSGSFSSSEIAESKSSLPSAKASPRPV